MFLYAEIKLQGMQERSSEMPGLKDCYLQRLSPVVKNDLFLGEIHVSSVFIVFKHHSLIGFFY